MQNVYSMDLLLAPGELQRVSGLSSKHTLTEFDSTVRHQSKYMDCMAFSMILSDFTT